MFVTQRSRGAGCFCLGAEIQPRRVLHLSARDGVPGAGPVVTHELRH